MLGRLVGLTQSRAHSDVLCKRCFNLVEQVDGLEIELADTKMELVQQYESTLSTRQPTTKIEHKPVSYLLLNLIWKINLKKNFIKNIIEVYNFLK